MVLVPAVALVVVAQPARCRAPGVVLGLHTVVYGARGISGWVFASFLLLSSS